jgi:tRNA(Arg) A34 adenosine deaminase TadA
MCSGGIILARVGRVVYGCSDPKAGAQDQSTRVYWTRALTIIRS